MAPEEPGIPKTTECILREEAEAIHGPDKVDSTHDKNLYLMLNNLSSVALCLSGGGIRSASFALGVIQALATHPRPMRNGNIEGQAIVGRPEDSLLAKFHYLSTVSGGGYIGSWLSAWVTRAGFPAVWSNLVKRPDGPDIEPPNLAWLRTYSNNLTPKLGIMSADAWAVVAIYVRNLVLNWIVILPVLILLLIALKFYALLAVWIGTYSPNSCTPLTWDNPTAISAVLGTLFLIIALSVRTYNRPSGNHSRVSQSKFLVWDLLPAVLAACLLVLALAPPCLHDLIKATLFDWSFSGIISIGMVAGAAIYALSWFIGLPRFRDWRDFGGDLVAWMIAGAIFGALIAVGVYFNEVAYDTRELSLDDQLLSFGASEILFLVCGVPWILGVQLLGEIIFVGLTSWEAGSDADREWLGRAAGWFAAGALFWLIGMALTFLGSGWASGSLLAVLQSLITSEWIRNLLAPLQSLLLPVGGISGLIVYLLSKSSLTRATDGAKSVRPRSGIEVTADVALAVAAPIFLGSLVIVFFIVVSSLIDQILFQRTLIKVAASRQTVAEGGYADLPIEATALLLGFMIVAVVGITASKFVNINRFSLHAVYRNRLIRAFLGASNPTRGGTCNPFTGFDECDNMPMSALWPEKAVTGQQPRSSAWRPFHVVNMALNIVSSKKLARQKRKAEPFTVSPLHSGSSCKAYRPTNEYGHRGDRGISLGTAMAISGAPASPNRGYHSSPSVTLLLALFSVRLGCWLGNPGEEGKHTYQYEGPRTAVIPLISEMFDLTTDDSKYVYLSDGGHFENLGLYEMVRRRCRLIVVSDAGCDPIFAFADLGNAVRKIALDLGVTIEFRGIEALKTWRDDDGERPKSAALPMASPYHAIGTIKYMEADGGGKDGIVLYIKPAFHGEADIGVRSYATANPDFPHESTGDQWFSESQFESYRALGFQITDGLLTNAFSGAARPQKWTIEEIFDALQSTLPAKKSEPVSSKD